MSSLESSMPDFGDDTWGDFNPETIPDYVPDDLMNGTLYDASFNDEASYAEPAVNEWNKQCMDDTIASNIRADAEVRSVVALRSQRSRDYRLAGEQEARLGQVSTTRRMIERYPDVKKATDEQLREAHRVRRMVFMHSGIDPEDALGLQRVMGAFVRTGHGAYSWEELDILAAQNLEQDLPELVKKLALSMPLCTQRLYDSSDPECARLWSIARITRLQIVAYRELTLDRALKNQEHGAA